MKSNVPETPSIPEIVETSAEMSEEERLSDLWAKRREIELAICQQEKQLEESKKVHAVSLLQDLDLSIEESNAKLQVALDNRNQVVGSRNAKALEFSELLQVEGGFFAQYRPQVLCLVPQGEPTMPEEPPAPVPPIPVLADDRDEEIANLTKELTGLTKDRDSLKNQLREVRDAKAKLDSEYVNSQLALEIAGKKLEDLKKAIKATLTSAYNNKEFAGIKDFMGEAQEIFNR